MSLHVKGGLLLVLVGSACGTEAADTDGSGTDGSGTDGSGTDRDDSGTDGSPLCTPTDWDGWTFESGVAVPEERGVDFEDDKICQAVTTETTALTIALTVPDGASLSPDGAVSVLVFEYDPTWADVSADCVTGVCESLDNSELQWTVQVPADGMDLSYYVSVDIDADGDGANTDCVDLSGYAGGFDPHDGLVEVPMELSCP